jgi:hypothetical protein
VTVEAVPVLEPVVVGVEKYDQKYELEPDIAVEAG